MRLTDETGESAECARMHCTSVQDGVRPSTVCGMGHYLLHILLVPYVHDAVGSEFFLGENLEKHLDWWDSFFLCNDGNQPR